ncbi:hypothetical protein IB276_18285 [Ensifer sp. ENS04]|uniref:hypothetical protein n=1 Tax=Ensifer sp. ENS04 TaxID=2769281 RepID=UPI001783709C|nr:hypothetical protein [Ensifer sp. ENS04]MBD9541405.1 hypothetical protein [Ensifer sp. ENS04]
MTKKQKRDRAYYEERLVRDYPAIYSDLVAGKYHTVKEAAVAAGLKRPRTRLHELKNAWGKSSDSEKGDFLSWLTTTNGLSPATPSALLSLVRHLLPETKSGINQIKAKGE